MASVLSGASYTRTFKNPKHSTYRWGSCICHNGRDQTSRFLSFRHCSSHAPWHTNCACARAIHMGPTTQHNANRRRRASQQRAWKRKEKEGKRREGHSRFVLGQVKRPVCLKLSSVHANQKVEGQLRVLGCNSFVDCWARKVNLVCCCATGRVARMGDATEGRIHLWHTIQTLCHSQDNTENNTELLSSS